MYRYTKHDIAGNALPREAPQWSFVVDNETGLMWPARDSNAKRVTHADAQKTVDSLNGAKLGGFSDWRLPTIGELLSLVDYTKFNPAIDTDFFLKVDTDSWYWTGTPAAYSPEACAWIVNFYGGNSGWGYRGIRFYVRAVRSLPRASQ
jgi:hypothetical protein